MGCDIHVHAEVKINGKWHHYGALDVDRSYGLFYKMAGVRGPYDGVKPISPPKGAPADMTDLTRFDLTEWNGDAHSTSWLGLDELVQLEEWMDKRSKDRGDLYSMWFTKTFGYCFGNRWTRLRQYPDLVPNGLEDVRFVFWFDN